MWHAGTAASAAEDLLDIYSKMGIQYQKDKPLPDIGMHDVIRGIPFEIADFAILGSRLEKYWYRVISHENYDCHILTIVCFLSLPPSLPSPRLPLVFTPAPPPSCTA